MFSSQNIFTRVTGGGTHHYTTEDLLTVPDKLFCLTLECHGFCTTNPWVNSRTG